MREAINNNPVVQIAVIGVLVVVVGLFMMMNMKKGSSSSSSSSDTASSAASSPTTPGSSAPATTVPVPGSATAGASSSGGAVPPVTGGTVSPDALVPGPGLPAPVIKAWKGGDAVALLIVRGGGIDDRLVRGSVQSLSGDQHVAVFVARAKDVARYSRITQGVGVDRAPALVIIRPRKESGSVPQAQVRYGFRNSQSVVQAVHDALYSGPDNLPYSPR
jgi:hypothetical protein